MSSISPLWLSGSSRGEMQKCMVARSNFKFLFGCPSVSTYNDRAYGTVATSCTVPYTTSSILPRVTQSMLLAFESRVSLERVPSHERILSVGYEQYRIVGQTAWRLTTDVREKHDQQKLTNECRRGTISALSANQCFAGLTWK
jgi:hypothetical protein